VCAACARFSRRSRSEPGLIECKAFPFKSTSMIAILSTYLSTCTARRYRLDANTCHVRNRPRYIASSTSTTECPFSRALRDRVRPFASLQSLPLRSEHCAVNAGHPLSNCCAHLSLSRSGGHNDLHVNRISPPAVRPRVLSSHTFHLKPANNDEVWVVKTTLRADESSYATYSLL
jgi:hypothetical protein